MTDNIDVAYLDENSIRFLRKGFKIAVDGYLSKGTLLYILDTVHDLHNEKKLVYSLVAKAAFILLQIISSHPFIDGNKRTAYGGTDVFLRLNGYCIKAEPEEALDFILKVATGRSDELTVRKWLRQHLKKLS
jgi:death-on-curing protein